VADHWELICHHTYTGTPGVVYDRSPSHRSHAAVVGLSDGDFLTDGAAPGSGAVSFFKPGARLRIPPSESWLPIGAVMGEVVVAYQPQPGAPSDFLIDSDSIRFSIRGGGLVAWFNAAPSQYAEVSTHMDPIVPWPGVPTGRWVTLGFLHDGFGTMELSMDGTVVARRTIPLWPVNPAGAVTIGNSSDGGSVLHGQLDEVKIWRRNPRQAAEEFLDRPMDDATAECLARFGRELAEVLRRHPECAAWIRATLPTVVDGLIREAMNKGPETRDRLQESAARYRDLWGTGRLDSDEMTSLHTEMATWLQLRGLPVANYPGLRSVLDSECWRVLRQELPDLDCDPQLMALWRSLDRSLEPRGADKSSTA